MAPAPATIAFTATPSTLGGGLAPGTYYYRVSCINPDGGETMPTGEISATLPTTGEIFVSWGSNAPVAGCMAYKVYVGTTSGGENQWLKIGANNYSGLQYYFANSVLDDGLTYTRTPGSPHNYDTAYLSKMTMGGFSYLLASSATPGNVAWDGTRLGIGTMTDPGTSSGIKLDVAGGALRAQSGFIAGASDPPFTNSPRAVYSAFLPALTAAATAATLTLDKAITVTRLQAQAVTPPSGCATNAIVRLTDGATPLNLTVSAAANDSGAIAQNYAAGAALTIGVSTAAAGCSTAPANVNVEVQYRMQ